MTRLLSDDAWRFVKRAANAGEPCTALLKSGFDGPLTVDGARQLFTEALTTPRPTTEMLWAVADFAAGHIKPDQIAPWPALCLGVRRQGLADVPEHIGRLWHMAQDVPRFRAVEVVAAMSRAEVVKLAKCITYQDVRAAANRADMDCGCRNQFDFFATLVQLMMFVLALPADFRDAWRTTRSEPLQALLPESLLEQAHHGAPRGPRAAPSHGPQTWTTPTPRHIARRNHLHDNVNSKAVWRPALRAIDLKVLRSPRSSNRDIRMVLNRWVRWADEGQVTQFLRDIYLGAIDELVHDGRCTLDALQAAARLTACEIKTVAQDENAGAR